MPTVTAIIKDPLGVKHPYRGTGTDIASARAELASKMLVVVGVFMSASATEGVTDTEDAAIVFSTDTVWGDLNLEFQKLSAAGLITRNVRLNEAESAINSFGSPDLLNAKLQNIKNKFEDSDGTTGFSLVKAKWEKKFSNS